MPVETLSEWLHFILYQLQEALQSFSSNADLHFSEHRVIIKVPIMTPSQSISFSLVFYNSSRTGKVTFVSVTFLFQLGFFKRYHLPSKKSSEGDDSDVGDSLLKKRNGQETED